MRVLNLNFEIFVMELGRVCSICMDIAVSWPFDLLVLFVRLDVGYFVL